MVIRCKQRKGLLVFCYSVFYNNVDRHSFFIFWFFVILAMVIKGLSVLLELIFKNRNILWNQLENVIINRK